MLKKMLICALCLLLVSAGAFAEGGVLLMGSAIIDGSTVYYSGTFGEGVFVTDAEGRAISSLSGSPMSLLASCGGNLLAASYDEDQYGLVVINALGETRSVAPDCAAHAITADGRFYWGVGSCALDGSDAITLIDDAERMYCYYPLAVEDGWYYYLDWAENADGALTEGSSVPQCARLCRLSLDSGDVQTVSGYGTTFLGIEDGYIYYSRAGFWLYDDELNDYYLAEVNAGLFRSRLSDLVTEQLAAMSDDENAYTSYSFMKDGVIYGTSSLYTVESSSFNIVRLTADGTELAPLSIDDQYVSLLGYENGLLYVSVCSVEYSEDDYIQNDLIYSINPADGSCALISSSASDLLYFSESEPAVAVVNGRLYMIVYDTENDRVCLKSCAVDGSDWRVIAAP